eukprot:scaffold8582_cov22-Tisochrysis_lutea.AAC.1
MHRHQLGCAGRERGQRKRGRHQGPAHTLGGPAAQVDDDGGVEEPAVDDDGGEEGPSGQDADDMGPETQVINTA